MFCDTDNCLFHFIFIFAWKGVVAVLSHYTDKFGATGEEIGGTLPLYLYSGRAGDLTLSKFCHLTRRLSSEHNIVPAWFCTVEHMLHRTE